MVGCTIAGYAQNRCCQQCRPEGCFCTNWAWLIRGLFKEPNMGGLHCRSLARCLAIQPITTLVVPLTTVQKGWLLDWEGAWRCGSLIAWCPDGKFGCVARSSQHIDSQQHFLLVHLKLFRVVYSIVMQMPRMLSRWLYGHSPIMGPYDAANSRNATSSRSASDSSLKPST